jgi:hypothetical protein
MKGAAMIVLSVLVVIVILIIIIYIRSGKENYTSTVNLSISKNANDADKFMETTITDASSMSKKVNEYYPIIIVKDSGAEYQFKLTSDGTTYVFDQQAGLSNLWDWSKGVCHLLVWVGGIASLISNSSTYDWRSNLKTQKTNITKTISDLPLMKTHLSTLNNKKVSIDLAKYKSISKMEYTNLKLILNSSVDMYITAATEILQQMLLFINKSLDLKSDTDEIKLLESNIADVIRNTSAQATWLMYAANDIIINRATRTILKWKQMMSTKQWNSIWVIIGTGMPGASVVVTPRGSCSAGNFVSQIMSQIMTVPNYNRQVVMYSGSKLTFDISASILNPQNISTIVGDKFMDSHFGRYLKHDLQSPNNALVTQFTKQSAIDTVSRCPFNNNCSDL